MAMTQGLLATMVADTAPAEMRGTAFGHFNFVSGVPLLIASGLDGLLRSPLGAAVTFAAGLTLAAKALVVLRRVRSPVRLHPDHPSNNV